jgi:hypothetical protein
VLPDLPRSARTDGVPSAIAAREFAAELTPPAVGLIQSLFCILLGTVAISLLAKIYLHYVFDLWARRWRRREATGDMIIVRYADDLIVGIPDVRAARTADRAIASLRKTIEELAAGRPRQAPPWSPTRPAVSRRSAKCSRLRYSSSQ